MGKSISFETREYAEDLYIVRGRTLEQTAKETGVSLSQVKAWSVTDGWKARREEHRRQLKDIRSDTLKLRKELISQALSSKDPQDVYAAAAFERMAHMVEKKNAAGEDVPPGEILREIATPADAIAALQEAVQGKINIMLSRPGEISLGAIKDMKQALGLLKDMQKEYFPEEAGRPAKKQLTPDTLKRIREEVYGLK